MQIYYHINPIIAQTIIEIRVNDPNVEPVIIAQSFDFAFL